MKNKKARRRLFVATLCLIIAVTCLTGSLYNYWVQIYNNKQEEKLLKSELTKLLSEEEDLKSEILKLEDPDYVARYAKEKYLYSGDGDVIIKIVK